MRPPRAAPILCETWYGDQGEELRITCVDGAALAEVTWPIQEGMATAVGWELELWLQPRDPRGWPSGPAIFVQRIPFTLLPEYGGTRYAGRCWLPGGMPPETLRAAYYRLVPRTPSVATESSAATD